jgi:hypothetical protein
MNLTSRASPHAPRKAPRALAQQEQRVLEQCTMTKTFYNVHSDLELEVGTNLRSRVCK